MAKTIKFLFLCLIAFSPAVFAHQSSGGGGGNSIGSFPSNITAQLEIFALATKGDPGRVQVCFSSGSTLEGQPYTVMLLFVGDSGAYLAEMLRTGGYTVKNPAVLKGSELNSTDEAITFRGPLANDDDDTLVDLKFSFSAGKNRLSGSLNESPLNADDLTCQLAR